MFKLNLDDRLSSWAVLRAQLETCEDPFQQVINFWQPAPYIHYNHLVDQYNKGSWPTPWEIIAENKYDDFTRAIMMGYSLKFTNRFKKSVITVQTSVDRAKKACYNIVCIDGDWAVNYKDNTPILLKDIPESFLVENIIEL